MDELQKQLDAAKAAFAAEKARADQAERDKLEADKARADAERAKITAEVAATNAQAALAAEKTRADTAQTALAAEKARADQAEASATAKARADAQGAFDRRVDARVKIFDAANRVLGVSDKDGNPVDRTALSDRAIKIEIIKHVDGLDVAAHEAARGEHFDAYVDGVFAGALERHERATSSRAELRVGINQGRKDHAQAKDAKSKDTEEASLASMRHDTATSWAQPRRRAK